MKRNQWTLITAGVVAALAIPVRLRLAAQDKPQAKIGPPGSAVATANYNFLIGSGLLCNSDDSTACPTVAKAANGETIEITGRAACPKRCPGGLRVLSVQPVDRPFPNWLGRPRRP